MLGRFVITGKGGLLATKIASRSTSETAAVFSSAIPRFAELLGDRFTTAESVLEHHGSDESWQAPQCPNGVCFPETTEEVVAIVGLCRDSRIPLIPFGAGSSLEGHVLAPHGGVSVDLSRMSRIVAVRPGDLDATVEAGVTRKQLDRRLRDQGLFFPVDPGADATLGGMAATRASGTAAVRYGTMRELVLSMEVVLASGEVIRTGSRARKSSSGYDLTRLFVGSEGTLGVITQLTLRLAGLPEAMSAGVVSFPDLGAAVEAAITTIQSGIPVARVELLDDVMMDAVNRWAQTDHPVLPTLFFEFHGSPNGVEEQVKETRQLAQEVGGSDFRWAREQQDREHLWWARHNAYYAARALRPGSRAWSTDVCVPLSRLAECIDETRRDLDQSFLLAPLVGHVGDGNFHLLMLVDNQIPRELDEARRLHERLVHRALRLEGTCTGEHGVGMGKRGFLPLEHGAALGVMQDLKRALDPLGLMNPGKIFLP